MADIRIRQLPNGGGPVASDYIPIDNGTTRRATIQDVVETGRPTASQAEAEAGTNPTKAMTPLTTKQSIASEVGVSIASAAQGALADGAAQKAQNLNDLSDKAAARSNVKVPTYVADRTALKALDTTKDIVSYLKEDGREGDFEWTSGDFSTQIAADTQEGLYIKADAVSATSGAWVRIFDGCVKPSWFGIIGDGSLEQTKIQALLNVVPGKEVWLENGATYGYNFLTVPDNVSFRGSGFIFRRLTASPSAGFRVNNWFRADYLRFSSPGGTGGDKCVRIQGSDNWIGYLHMEADAEGNESSSNWAIEMESNPVGSVLSRNTIEAAYCRNYSTLLLGELLSLIDINNVVVENYRTAVYLKDIVRSRFVNFRISGLGAAVNGAPGENGLLLESTTPKATSDVVFEDWIVEDSGEHAYRLGGQQTIARVTFNRCVSRRSGSSILSGNLTSGEWHGGCGFKVLGGSVVGATRHKDIIFNECKVFDVNQTFGTYPAGHGVNNFTPFMIVLADGVQLNGCVVDGEDLATSCRYGFLTSCCNGVFVNDCDFRKCELTALKPYQEALFPGFPGYEAPLTEFHVHGGKFEVVTAAAAAGIVYYMFENATFAHKNWSIKDAQFRGGAQALRVEATGVGGSYTNCIAEFTYLDPTSVTDAAATSPIITGDGVANWICDFRSVNRPSAFGITISNGSVHTRLDTAKAYDRIASAWYERVVQSTSGYTPTATIITNLDAATPSFCSYYRVNDMVHVFGQMTFDATASGTISARITLPVASNFTANRQASGTFDSSDGTIHGSIGGDTTNDQLIFSGNSSVTSARACSFLATYLIV